MVRSEVVKRIVILCFLGVDIIAGIFAYAKRPLGNPSARVEAPKYRAECPDDAGGATGYQSIDVAGVQRRFYVVPPTQGRVVDLVIGFHGRSRSGEQVAHTWDLDRVGLRPYVALFPDGATQKWFHDLFGWDTRSEASPDLAFYDALVDWAETRYCIDRSRIHVVGHSWGSGMANLVACARKGVRTMVSVGGGGPTFPCQAPVAAMVVHGDADQEEPISSGQLAVTSWSFYNRCAATSKPSKVEGCVEFDDCLKDAPLLWCEHGGGHGWPDFLRGSKLISWLQRP